MTRDPNLGAAIMYKRQKVAGTPVEWINPP